MAQSSGPIAQGTDAERQFTDVMWRDMFGDQAGVVGDLNGSAYQVSLAPDSDVAQVGSASQASIARVAGFVHRIPAGSPEPITVPAASGTARTDIIALRYDPAFTGAPGPVRLARIAGTSAGLPVYDDSAPGIEDLPLWAITRQPGQALSQATVRQLFPRLTFGVDVPVGAPLPPSRSLSTIARQGSAEFIRTLGGGGVPVWASTAVTPPAWQNITYAQGYSQAEATGPAQGKLIEDGATVRLRGGIRRSNNAPHGSAVFPFLYGTLPTALRPSGTKSRWLVAHGTGGTAALLEIETNGRIMLKDTTNRNVTFWISLDGLTFDK
jgi:hypothetical protein